jgi:hypothetical protein
MCLPQIMCVTRHGDEISGHASEFELTRHETSDISQGKSSYDRPRKGSTSPILRHKRRLHPKDALIRVPRVSLLSVSSSPLRPLRLPSHHIRPLGFVQLRPIGSLALL